MSGGRSLKYLTIGLRRDKNFLDLQDKEQALNNLLNDVVSTTEPGTSFISEDLDALRGLQSTNVTLSKLTELADITVKYSALEEGLIVEKTVTPIVTLRDRIENAYLITSENPAIQGGKGLNCRFIESTEINPGTKTSTGEPGPNSTEGTPSANGIFDFKSDQIKEIFWAAGYFNFPTTIDPTFRNQYGGLQWTGWFAPSLRDPNVNITLYSTGLYLFEYDLREDGNWETLASVYDTEREITVLIGGVDVTTVTLIPGDVKYVAVGDYWGSYTLEGPNVTVIDIQGDVVTLDNIITVNDNTLVTVIKVLGETRTYSVVNLPTVPVSNFVKVRISVWWPDNDETLSEKNADFNYIGSNLSFYYMYDTKPEPPVADSDEIRTFLNEIVTPYQNQIGSTGQYKNFYVNNSSLLNFVPVSGFSQIVKHSGTVNVTYNDYNSIITISSSSTTAAIGDIIVPAISTSFISSLPDKLVVIKDDVSSTVKVITRELGQSQEIPSYIVNHRGFVDWIYGTISGTTVTITVGNTDLLRLDFLVIRTNTALDSWIRITSIDQNTNTFTTSVGLGDSATDVLVLIYSDKTLIDTSKDVPCQGVFGQVVRTTAAQGSIIIEMISVSGIVANNFYVQFDGFTDTSTLVTAVDGVTNTITIDKPIISQILQDSTLVFIPTTTSASNLATLEACVVPLNTAPPFIGTPAGLSAFERGIRSSTPTLAITTNNIVLDLPQAKVTTTTTPSQFDRKVFLTINGNQYGILGKSV